MQWQAIAKSLPMGAARKIPCCSKDASAYVSQDKHGLRLGPCFRCGRKEFEPHGPRSIADILAARRAIEQIQELRSIPDRAILLSDPETSSEARLWVLKAGMSPETAQDDYGMRYDPFTRRVCIPLDGGFLARAVHGERPKYVKAGATNVELYDLSDGTDAVVITEDILSAIAVRRAGFGAIAVLGTSITTKIAVRLSKFRNVLCWTDGDKAGDAAWVRLRKVMALHPCKLIRLRTEADPKEIHAGDIRRIIGENYDF